VSLFSPSRRAEVTARAEHRCEYCHLPTRGQVATFPIDHIIPKRTGSSHDPENLALACPQCNAHKWTAIQAQDPATGRFVALFHPRCDDWNEHFEWLGDGELGGRTPCARATVVALQMNSPTMIDLRRLLSSLGLFPESS